MGDHSAIQETCSRSDVLTLTDPSRWPATEDGCVLTKPHDLRAPSLFIDYLILCFIHSLSFIIGYYDEQIYPKVQNVAKDFTYFSEFVRFSISL